MRRTRGHFWHRRLACALGVAMVATAGATVPAQAADAPGAPGIDATWATGAKTGFGTATGTASKLWYTLGEGIAHELYYPQLDVPNVTDLQFLVSDGTSVTEAERDATTHETTLRSPRSLTHTQTNTARSGKYRITKTYVTDPERPVMLMRTRFEVLSGDPLGLYLLYNPSLAGSGMGDTGASANGKLVASDGEVASALAADTGFEQASNGYSGTPSDGYRDLTANHRLTNTYDTAGTPGNLVQTARVPVGTDTTFTVALGFGENRAAAAAASQASLDRGFDAVAGDYTAGWNGYLDGLAEPPQSVSGNGMGTQYDVARMSLAAQEDKTYRGAFVASPTIPWGQAQNANDCCTAGYHAIWARDLYQTATAFLATGDRAAADRALDYLLEVQQREDGSFPQNTWLDGRPVFDSLQLDEVAFPIVLAWQLGRNDAATWGKLKRSADFLVRTGPVTPQERWEEEGGYSPSTIAAQIAGLVTAADLARANGDTAAAETYLSTADDWQSKVDGWTFTTSGPHGDGRYYERIDDNGNPNDGAELCLNNGGGCHDERSIMDSGFLDLVRLGVKRADDPAITGSLSELDATTKVQAPNGPQWYRYNHDGYGETGNGAPFTGQGVGRLWPLLAGERGEYAIAAGQPALEHLRTMADSANEGYQIPEQVWDRADAAGFTFGEGTGSATPLAWSLAQFVRLAHNIDAGRNLETPSVVADRYTR